MSIVINILYKGEGNSAQQFAQEMRETGTLAKIRAELGNLRYDYFLPLDDAQSLLLIDEWIDQEAIDRHHKSEMMATIADLRKKYHLHMTVTRYEGRCEGGSL